MRQQLNLSMSINPELLTAQELFNILKVPSAVKIEYFSGEILKWQSCACERTLYWTAFA